MHLGERGVSLGLGAGKVEAWREQEAQLPQAHKSSPIRGGPSGKQMGCRRPGQPCRVSVLQPQAMAPLYELRRVSAAQRRPSFLTARLVSSLWSLICS